jgi:transcription antitermination factor NusG
MRLWLETAGASPLPVDGYWAVVQTQSRYEHVVRLLLMRSGHQTFLPRIKHRSRIAPLFPGYLFVFIIDQWWEIRWTPHVVRLIMGGEQPAAVPETFIADIRKRQRNGFVQLPLPFKQGQRVRVSRGTFMGQVGIYAGMTGKQREAVLLEFMGRTVQIEMRAGNLNVVA